MTLLISTEQITEEYLDRLSPPPLSWTAFAMHHLQDGNFWVFSSYQQNYVYFLFRCCSEVSVGRDLNDMRLNQLTRLSGPMNLPSVSLLHNPKFSKLQVKKKNKYALKLKEQFTQKCKFSQNIPKFMLMESWLRVFSPKKHLVLLLACCYQLGFQLGPIELIQLLV